MRLIIFASVTLIGTIGLCPQKLRGQEPGDLRPTESPAFHKTIAKLEHGKPVTVVCFGDSVTGIYYHTGGRRAYTTIVGLGLQKAFPKAKVHTINAGISGHTTVNALARIRRDVLDHKPDVVTVMFGLNDLVRVSVDQYRDNLKAIVTQCRKSGAEVLLCTPNNIITSTAGRPDAKLQMYCAVVREVGLAMSVPVCDMYKAMQSLRANNQLEWRLLMSDAIHPNMDGHKMIATEIVRSITGRELPLRAIDPPALSIPKTVTLLRSRKPIKVLAMPPYDLVIPSVIKSIAPDAEVEVSVWPVSGQSLAEIEAYAKKVRAMKVDLVVIAVPRSAGAATTEQFIHSHTWIMNWSLSFGLQQWDVIAITPSVTASGGPDHAESEKRIRRLIKAQGIGMIDRGTKEPAPALDLVSRWFANQLKAAP